MMIEVHKSDEMGNVFRLLEPLMCRGLIVPAGFESDGASVPRLFWGIVFPPGDTRALRAAFLHDWIYRTHPAGWSREAADNLFRKVLSQDGVPRISAGLAFWGVRIFGASSWRAAA